MIVVRLRGGLGNQMFQYAFFRQMQYWHGKENVKLDVDTHHWNEHNGRELDAVFEIDLSGESVEPKVSFALADVGNSYTQKILRKIRGVKHNSYRFWTDLKLSEYKNLPPNVYLEGYWNEETYFHDVREEIRKVYTFPPLQNEFQTNLLEDIQSSESIGIHVRRGDYVQLPNRFPTCPPSYYAQALQIIERKHPTTKCFVFSDDIQWCKDKLTFLSNVVFVENTEKSEAHIDMMLMSKCQHVIMANSTFSWWAAWLNSNVDKTVIYPESATITYASLPANWVKI